MKNKDIFTLLIIICGMLLFAVLMTISKCASAQQWHAEVECETQNAVITWDTALYQSVWVEKRTNTMPWTIVGGTDNTGIRKQYLYEPSWYRLYADGKYSEEIMLVPCNYSTDKPTQQITNGRQGIYDMQGRKLKVLPAVQGVYIVDGKKVVVL